MTARDHDTDSGESGRTAPDLDAPWTYATTAARRLGVPDEIEHRLLYPRQRQRLSVPFERDDGTLGVCEGYRVRHDGVRGPFVGPHRYADALTGDDCAGLAAATTVGAAIAGVPFGGAAGGIAVDPTTLSRDERVRLIRAYAARVDGVGPDGDVLVPDVGTDERTMARFADAIADRIDGPPRATVAGKPPAVGGFRDIPRASGHSVAHVTQDVLETDRDRPLSEATIAVAGTGTVGATAARLLEFWGGTVVAMCSDRAGLTAPADEDGLDADLAPSYLDRPGALAAYDDGTMTGTENVLERDADVLVLAAPATAVTAENAAAIRSDLVVEGAVGGVTPGGQAALEERGVTVVPATLATAGTMVAAHLEWVQSVGRDRLSDARVTNEFGYALTDAVADVRDRRESCDLTWRQAAYSVGLSRVAAAHEVVR
ncbi:Glu/Leu/Phe/Val family dehydrogenase [Natrinema salifodinae]|uniref:Glutamate dehydrogenase n=1 Tax=Natrinema salifodinae TaxID=1202768 RepID=A0A1I0NKQ6_9EURY|nr:Glu/Leu/Phe/Val dehydrogenase dimerization domain-containing protein [Natrinema salifodinae]SEW02031.1 glutamate dehydrogenase (NAD(P)+) [Natrinema salifodinae]